MSPIGTFNPIYVTDKDGNASSAYQAPGTATQYLTTGYKGIGGDATRTVMAWFKTNTSVSRKTIVSWGENNPGEMFNLMIYEGHVRVEGGSCNVTSTIGNLDNSEWHHVAITYNPAGGDKLKDIKIYIDGVLSDNIPDEGIGGSYQSEITSINTNNTKNNIRIGASNYHTAYYWIGEIDEVRIYNTELSLDEIKEISGVTVGINAIEEENLVNMFSGKSMIIIDLKSLKSSKASIYDLNGRLVKISTLHQGKNNINLKSGLYLVYINIEGKIEKGKVISY